MLPVAEYTDCPMVPLVQACCIIILKSIWPIAKNTPVLLSCKDALLYPASWKASYPSSNTRRCCGSIILASAGEMPKKPASNHSASWRNAPYRMPCSTSEKVPSNGTATTSHLSSGTSPTTSCAYTFTSQKEVMLCTPPATRQLMPTTATSNVTS